MHVGGGLANVGWLKQLDSILHLSKIDRNALQFSTDSHRSGMSTNLAMVLN